MSEPTFASLSPTLLARKGGAKPAMRRQSMAVAGAVAHQPSYPAIAPEDALEDLGWNDLGETVSPSHEPAPHDHDVARPDESEPEATETDVADDDLAEEEAGDNPVADRFASLGEHASSSATTRDRATDKVTPIHKGAPRLPRPRLAVTNTAPVTAKQEDSGKRAAFTLRLNRERHLKLRLASTLAGRSAQALVTEAVDAMFADIPELDALVARVQSRPPKEG